MEKECHDSNTGKTRSIAPMLESALLTRSAYTACGVFVRGEGVFLDLCSSVRALRRGLFLVFVVVRGTCG